MVVCSVVMTVSMLHGVCMEEATSSQSVISVSDTVLVWGNVDIDPSTTLVDCSLVPRPSLKHFHTMLHAEKCLVYIEKIGEPGDEAKWTDSDATITLILVEAELIQ